VHSLELWTPTCPEWTCCLYSSGKPPESRDAWEELGILSSWQKRVLHRERQFGERLSLSSHRSWQLHLVLKIVERISPAATTAHML